MNERDQDKESLYRRVLTAEAYLFQVREERDEARQRVRVLESRIMALTDERDKARELANEV